MSNLIVCPYCGKDIEDDSKYCDQCGGQLKKCQKCGYIGKGKRCTKDGDKMLPVGSTPSQSGNSPSQSQTTPTIQPVQQTPITSKYPVTFSVNGINGVLKAKVDDKDISSGDMVEADKKIIFTADPSPGYRTKKTWKRNNKDFRNSIDVFIIAKLAATENITVEFRKLFPVKKFIGFSALIVILLVVGVLLVGYFRGSDSRIVKYNPIPYLKNTFLSLIDENNEQKITDDTEIRIDSKDETQRVQTGDNPIANNPQTVQGKNSTLSNNPVVTSSEQHIVSTEQSSPETRQSALQQPIVQEMQVQKEVVVTSEPDVNIKQAREHFNQGEMYYIAGNIDKAITEYDSAIRLNPNYAEAYNKRGLAFFSKGELDRATADLEYAASLAR